MYTYFYFRLIRREQKVKMYVCVYFQADKKRVFVFICVLCLCLFQADKKRAKSKKPRKSNSSKCSSTAQVAERLPSPPPAPPQTNAPIPSAVGQSYSNGYSLHSIINQYPVPVKKRNTPIPSPIIAEEPIGPLPLEVQEPNPVPAKKRNARLGKRPARQSSPAREPLASENALYCLPEGSYEVVLCVDVAETNSKSSKQGEHFLLAKLNSLKLK